MSVAITKKEKRMLSEMKRTLTKSLPDCTMKFVIFGSRAKGDFDSKSDLDVAVIVRGLNGKLKNRMLDIIAGLEFKHLTPVSALILSDDEFECLKKRERRIALDIEKEGVAL